MDLVGRKLPKNFGRGITQFFKDCDEDMYKYRHDSNMNTNFITPVTNAIEDLKQATKWLMNNAMKNPNNAGSAAYDYMEMFGLVLLGLAHVKIAYAAKDDKDRWNTAQYFMDRILPETSFLLKRIRGGSNTMMNAKL
jgi:hypothetical protein